MNRKNRRPAAQMRTKPSVRKTKQKASSAAKSTRTKSSREKVRAYRQRMRAKGLRLVQMWLPDTRTPEFAAEAHRQSLLANTSPFAAEDQAWVDSVSDWNSD
jgi:DNA-binding LacI/PurR family transcriptional regulator